MNALILPALLLVCAADDKPPTPKVPVGKDTTYVTGPLDKGGYIDYEAALNDRLGKGATADNNANVLLWKAFGPKPEGSNMPAEYFKRLGIAEPAEGGDYFINTHRYLRDVLKIEPQDFQIVYDQQDRARTRPWTAKDYPDVAAWLKANEKPLAHVIEATRRSHYFNPLVSKREEGGPSSLIGCLLPSVQMCRELASALTLRAMLRLGEGKPADAWADLLAVHRLSRHLSHGGTLIETLVAYAIHAIACNATLTYIEHTNLTADQYLARLKELRELPPMGPLVDKIDISERMMGLDTVQMLSRGDGKKLAADEQKALAAMDWGAIMKTMNAEYDRMAGAMRIKDRPDREKALDKIDADLNERMKKYRDADVQKLMKEVGAGKMVSKQVGEVLMGLLMPAIRKVQIAADRTEQVNSNVQVALALAAYRKAEGRYPAQLADLAPKYLAAVPGDLFSGKELIYQPTATGYRFYSVGANGKDEGGQWYGDDPPGDDPGVRMPRPEPKKK